MQVEWNEGTYPEAIAFLSLLSSLLKSTSHVVLAETLGGLTRVPGLGPYLNFVAGLFIHAGNWTYRVAHQQWKVSKFASLHCLKPLAACCQTSGWLLSAFTDFRLRPPASAAVQPVPGDL